MERTIKKLGFRLLVAFVTALSVFGTLYLKPAPAYAASGCVESRDTAINLANSGNYVEAARVDLLDAKVRLLYSSDSGCMWGKIQDLPFGLMTGRHYGHVWLERSSNGGATYTETPTAFSNGDSYAFTPTYNSIGYDAVRVCGTTAMNENIWSTNPYNTIGSVDTGCSKWFWPGRLYPGMYMGHRGFSCLSSQNNRYVFCMQGDGNLVLYSPAGAVWASNTYRPGSKLIMQNDGNLVIYDSYGRAVWATGTMRPGTVLVVQNDGNVVLYSPNGAVWATNTVGR